MKGQEGGLRRHDVPHRFHVPDEKDDAMTIRTSFRSSCVFPLTVSVVIP